MAQRLAQVELDEVSLVDEPANQMAKVVLMKRRDEMEKAKGIKFVIGFKEDGGSEVQSVLFDSATWDADRAKAWLKEHDMSSGKLDETENKLRFRQRDPDQYQRMRTITPGAQMSKALRARGSFQVLQTAVDSAVRLRFQATGTPSDGRMGGSYLWVRDLFKDAVVFDLDGQTWRAEYEVAEGPDGEMTVSFSEKVPVEVVYQDVKKDRKCVKECVSDCEEECAEEGTCEGEDCEADCEEECYGDDEEEDDEDEEEGSRMRKQLEQRLDAMTPLSERLAKLFELVAAESAKV